MAYRKLSLKYHPDRNKDDKNSEKFKRIVEAYQFLRLEEKKSYRKSQVDVESTYAEFWKFHDKKVNEDLHFYNRSNFAGFGHPFGVNVNESYSHNQEKPVSHVMTHLLLYLGLALMSLWIILSTILK